MVNLRGIRETGLAFSAPAYIYLVAILGLLGSGYSDFVDRHNARLHAAAGLAGDEVAEPLGISLILRAFASGSVALTGTEAVADGVQAFKPPETRTRKRC